jgi:endo-1,4-beta-xylanase
MVATISMLFGAYKVNEYCSGSKGEEESSFLSESLRKNATTLREAAKGTGIYIGAAMNQRYMKKDSDYSVLGAKEYSLLTEENACKMTAIAKSFTDLDVTNCNYTANFAAANGMAMRGHNLIWGAPTKAGHQHNPEFINNEKNATKLEEFMVEYIG